MAIPTKADQQRIVSATSQQLVNFVNAGALPGYKVSLKTNRAKLEDRAKQRLKSVAHSYGPSSGARPRLAHYCG